MAVSDSDASLTQPAVEEVWQLWLEILFFQQSSYKKQLTSDKIE